MIGSAGAHYQDVDGANLTQEFARLVRGRYYSVHAPLVVERPQLRQALMQERDVAEVLELARNADIAIVGIGSVVRGFSSLVRAGYLQEENLLALRQAGAVGDICARHFDFYGRELPIDLNQRIVSVGLTAIKNIPLVIGIAGGKEKARGLLGALNGGYLDVLITDSVAANELLCIDDRLRGKE